MIVLYKRAFRKEKEVITSLIDFDIELGEEIANASHGGTLGGCLCVPFQMTSVNRVLSLEQCVVGKTKPSENNSIIGEHPLSNVVLLKFSSLSTLSETLGVLP